MFSKPNKVITAHISTPTIIGTDITVTGNIDSKGEVHVDGLVKGDIQCDVLVIGQHGVVNGCINSRVLRILGNFNGHIKAATVEISKEAHVISDIEHESISVEAGGIIEGRLIQQSPQLKSLPKQNSAPDTMSGQ